MVSDSDKDVYTNLTTIMKDSIQWKHIEEHYDEAVKHLVALKLGLLRLMCLSNDLAKIITSILPTRLFEIGKSSQNNLLMRLFTT